MVHMSRVVLSSTEHFDWTVYKVTLKDVSKALEKFLSFCYIFKNGYE